MNTGTSSLFCQLLSLVDRDDFRRLVRQTGSEARSKGFASWDHFVSMLFCQLAQAKFRSTKGAAKLHLLLDHDGCLPCYARITEGKVADVTVAQQLKLPKGSLVVMDRGYTDYYMYERWSAEGVGFVTRLKKNAEFYEFTDQPVKPGGVVVSDHIGQFNVFEAGD
jgi:hypothetical protein